MNPYLLFIIIVLCADYLLDVTLGTLNLNRLCAKLPDEFEGIYKADRYARSQEYIRDQTRLSFWWRGVILAVLLFFILLGGFNWVDIVIRLARWNDFLSGLTFATILIVLQRLINLPYQYHYRFGLDARYGLNRMKRGDFFRTFIKRTLLKLATSLPPFAVAIWAYTNFELTGWLSVWGLMSSYEVFMHYIQPTFIMPHFNKFEQIEAGELNDALTGYAKEHDFKMSGVYKSDSSRRTGKSNAFIAGFGRNRRIVLSDTLIQQHSIPELKVIFAHEVGHMKSGHTFKHNALPILANGLMLFLANFFIRSQVLSDAFGIEHFSIYANLILFNILYTPMETIKQIVFNAISRYDEYQADAYAVKTTGGALEMIKALKKAGMNRMANLTPHPFVVALSYNHPPIVERIQALRKMQ